MDQHTADVLEVRAAELGVTVPRLIAELAALDRAPRDADAGDDEGVLLANAPPGWPGNYQRSWREEPERLRRSLPEGKVRVPIRRDLAQAHRVEVVELVTLGA